MNHVESTTFQLQLVSFICWSSMYILVCYKTGGEPEWCNRLVTLLHGSSATLLGLKYCNFRNLTDKTDRVTWIQNAIMFSSWGYFAFDLIWCFLYWTEGPLMLCHHICSLATLTRYIWKGYSGNRFCLYIAALEASNPLLQTRWFIRYYGHKKTKLFTVIDILYLSSFIIIRGVFGTFFVFKTLDKNSSSTMEEKIMVITLYLVSLIFMWGMYLYVCKKYKVPYIFW